MIPYLHNWVGGVFRDFEGNLIIKIPVNFQAYLERREAILERELASGELSPSGAAMFMEGHNLFFRISIETIMELMEQ